MRRLRSTQLSEAQDVFEDCSLGCNQVEDVAPYVVTPFSGTTGARQWQEKWLVKGGGKQYAIDIDFKEDGAGGAYWTITK